MGLCFVHFSRKNATDPRLGNWQGLTNLTLPSSPYLFLDYGSFDEPGRVYRTTPRP
ncbi:MAG: hypothetical protein HY674_07015 [Chloroflexi bacterium]|nr:hypothetical protein [Chloroflexota bacterium]